MAKKKFHGSPHKPQFSIPLAPGPDTGPVDATSPLIRDKLVKVSFRYFEKKFECLSEWQKADLVCLSNEMEKMGKRTADQIKSTTKNCHAHIKGKKADEFFSRIGIQDITMYSLKVSPAARVHGFFDQGYFFLVWLDRQHAILKV